MQSPGKARADFSIWTLPCNQCSLILCKLYHFSSLGDAVEELSLLLRLQHLFCSASQVPLQLVCTAETARPTLQQQHHPLVRGGPKLGTSMSLAVTRQTELSCHHASGWGRACQALTQQPGGARPAAPQTRLPSPPALLRVGAGKHQLCFPHPKALLAPREQGSCQQGPWTGSGKAAAAPSPCQAGRHSDPDKELCMLWYLGAAALQAARAAGPAHPAARCQAVLGGLATHKWPGPGRGPAPTPHCCQDLLCGKRGGLSLTSVTTMVTVVDPDRPPSCPAMSVARITTS